MTDMSLETIEAEEHFSNSAIAQWFTGLYATEQDEWIAEITGHPTAYVRGYEVSYTHTTALTVEYAYIEGDME